VSGGLEDDDLGAARGILSALAIMAVVGALGLAAWAAWGVA
jgi:hypothetical protein